MGALQMDVVDASDCGKLVGLLGKVFEAQMPPGQRRQRFMHDLCSLVQADVFRWSCDSESFEATGETESAEVMDGGWNSPAERSCFLHLIATADDWLAMTAQQATVSGARQPGTMFLRDLAQAEQGKFVGAQLRDLGFSDCLLSVYRGTGGSLSRLELLRRTGRPPFAERERLLVQLVFQNVEWLHRQSPTAPASESAMRLSPRQKAVLLLLLQGDSQKDVAKKLRISPHTVVGYMREIYRGFGVNSRGELLAQFIGPNPRSLVG